MHLKSHQFCENFRSVVHYKRHGNSFKSIQKHGVDNEMVEAIFKDDNLLALGEQCQPETDESRYGIIGKTKAGDILFVCFTMREKRIRPISSRYANLKERELYEKEIY